MGESEMIKWSDETVTHVAVRIAKAKDTSNVNEHLAQAALAAVAQCKEVQTKDAALIKARNAFNRIITGAGKCAVCGQKCEGCITCACERGRWEEELPKDVAIEALTAINEVLS
jgi:hypothetical protein